MFGGTDLHGSTTIQRRRKMPFVAFAAVLAALISVPIATSAQARQAPHVDPAFAGAVVERVTVEAYGTIRPEMARRYLTTTSGTKLEQASIDRDYANLSRLGEMNVRLDESAGSRPNTVVLNWVLMAKWLRSTTHPFYGDQPLSAPIQGVGFILTAPPVDARGTNVSAYTQLSKRANLARALLTVPLSLDATRGRQTSLIFDAYGSRGVYRASQPYAINVYSWTRGEEALFFSQGTNGTQFEGGFRYTRSTNAKPAGIQAPTLFRTDLAPARIPSVVAAVSHACTVPAYEWRPPLCRSQFRVAVFDGIGGFGSTNQYRIVSADVARYFRAGLSTLAIHANAVRSGGILADSGLVCATVRGYPKSFCGTDAEGATVELRLNDATAYRRPLEWVLFTEDAASRVRDAQAFALPYFTWHPDSGIGVIYRGGFRFDLAGGQSGMRLTFELKGQLY